MKLNTILLFLTITIGVVSASSLYSQESLSINEPKEKKVAKVAKVAKVEKAEIAEKANKGVQKLATSKKISKNKTTQHREEMDAPVDADGNQIIIEMPVMKKRKTREAVMEMPGPPAGPPKMPAEFQCLVGWGTGNMLHFGGDKQDKQITVVSKLTSEGLLFKTKDIQMKNIKGKAVTNEERLNVFMNSLSSDNKGDWVIPSRKIIGCEIAPKGKPEPNNYSYEILTMQDDRKNGKSDQYSIQLRNNYVYLENEQGDRISNPVNGEKFCANVKYGGTEARAAIAGIRQELFKNLEELKSDCNNAHINSQDTKNKEKQLQAYIPSTEDEIKAKKEQIQGYVDYKKTCATNIALAEKEKAKQEALKAKLQQEIEDLKSELNLELIKIATYKQNEKLMDNNIVEASAYKYAAQQEEKRLIAEQKAKEKVNSDAANKSIKKAEDLVKKYEESAKEMAAATRGIRQYTQKSVAALKKIMTEKCGKSSNNLLPEAFKPVTQPLKQIYCTADQPKVNAERKKRGIESEFVQLR